VHYISTRDVSNHGFGAVTKSFKEILLEGLAPDGGLYTLMRYPKISQEDLEGLRGANADYVKVAQMILPKFICDIPHADSNRIIAETYTPEIFGAGITPLKWLEHDFALLQLSNGPTLAFKDVAMQLLGNLMEFVLKENGEELNILGASSGDTVSAAEYAFRGKSSIRIFMLTPQLGCMSRFQKLLIYTLDDPNIYNLVVNGTFDDCQAVVKAVNADAVFKKRYKIGAVNSINWARIAAQVVYYAYAYLQATKRSIDEVSFVVPSGNFGNALSAYTAKQMGIPIHEIIVATNENDVLDQFFKKGVYRMRKREEVKFTLSPSMDITAASNFERFMFDVVGRDPKQLCLLWEQLKEQNQFTASSTKPGKPYGICSGSATDSDVITTICGVYRKWGVVVDPHTAVGMKVGMEQRDSHFVPLIIAETAQPAKFADTIFSILGFRPPIPERYKGLEDLPEHKIVIEADPEAVKEFIANHVH